MKNKLIILCISLISSFSLFAKNLNDVSVLDIQEEKSKYIVKMRTADGEKDSFFFVRLQKNDPNFVEKYKLFKDVLEKKTDKKLNLEIKSFSTLDSGSSYPAEHVNIK